VSHSVRSTRAPSPLLRRYRSVVDSTASIRPVWTHDDGITVTPNRYAEFGYDPTATIVAREVDEQGAPMQQEFTFFGWATSSGITADDTDVSTAWRTAERGGARTTDRRRKRCVRQH
jgi:hypothetical protein